MATRYPYVTGIAGLDGTITHLRSSFPQIVDSAALKKLGFAPNSESRVINVLRFLNILGEDGGGTDVAKETFLQHNDAEFQQRFGQLVQSSYAALFDLHGDNAWKQSLDSLIQFFRTTDKTSAIVGRRQANTFLCLSQLAGHDAPTEGKQKSTPSAAPRKERGSKRAVSASTSVSALTPERAKPKVGLTVRIEVNLPADGSQETYDRIFKSIREHFIDG